MRMVLGLRNLDGQWFVAGAVARESCFVSGRAGTVASYQLPVVSYRLSVNGGWLFSICTGPLMTITHHDDYSRITNHEPRSPL